MTHMALARGPTSAATRSRISAAALLVKVMARIWPGCDATLAEQPGDAVGQHAGLARPRAGDDEQRAALVDDRLALLRVEPLEQHGRVEVGAALRRRLDTAARGGLGPRRDALLGDVSAAPGASGVPDPPEDAP